MNILLLQDHDEVREKLVFWLENAYGAYVKEAASIREAIDLLRNNDPPFDFMIYDFQKTPLKEFRAFRAKVKTIPCVLSLQGVSGEIPKELKENQTYVVNRSVLLEDLQKTVGEMVKSGTVQPEYDRREFCQIRTHLLLSVCPLLTDIYIRLSEKKFVKLFRQGDDFERSDLEKYTVRKGVHYLYLRKSETDEFVRKYTDELKSMLGGKPATVDDAANKAKSAFELVQELGARIGFTPAVQEIVKTQVQINIKAMGSSPNLRHFLSKIDRNKSEYIGAHSILTAQLSCAVASQMEWGSDATYQKLNLAAFLHDITLENQRLAACGTLRDVMEQAFSQQDLEEFKDHPAKAAAIAQSFHEVPPDVDAIVLQHHERPEGNGFPRSLGRTYIAPLACIFIVAHDLAQFLLNSDLPEATAVQQFLVGVHQRYSSGQFKKVFKALETCIRGGGAAGG